MFRTRKPDVIDVTDHLTPGAKAAAKERTERLIAVASEHVGGHVHVNIRPLDTAFEDGRAYERGANIRRRVNVKAATRERAALGIARDYLTDGDPRRAALVLAGFTGTDPAQVA